jgi:predicted amidophosphoribosyltransferase
MGTLEVRDCAICGKLFRSYGRNICGPCLEQADRDFLRIRDYIYDTQKSVDVKDIHEHTGVSEKMILYLMKEGRLSKVDAKTGHLKCTACGAPIPGGKLCPKCSAVWSAEHKRQAGRPDVEQHHVDFLGSKDKMHTYGSKGS